MTDKKILVIIPAFNESQNIQSTVSEVLDAGVGADVLVVNDGSLDDTAVQAGKTSAMLVTLPYNLGIGGAVQTGFQFAFKNGYDIAVQVDGDGQHDCGYLKDIIAPVEKGETDVAIGSRFIGEFTGYRSSFVRRIGINFFAHLLSGLTGCRITDPTSGFRALSRRAVRLFSQEYPCDFPEPEAVLLAKRSGLNVVEIPVKMRKRQSGLSSIRYLKTLYYMIKVTFAILLNMIKRRKVIEP